MDKQGMNGIAVVWDKKDHIYKIKGSAQKEIDEFVLANTSIEETILDPFTGKFTTAYKSIDKITSEEMYKAVFKKRTNLNNKIKEISKKRKQAISIMINDFQTYCKGVESQLDEASNKLTVLLNEFKPKEKTAKPTVYKLVVKTTDIDLYEKVKNYAKENGLEVED